MNNYLVILGAIVAFIIVDGLFILLIGGSIGNILGAGFGFALAGYIWDKRKINLENSDDTKSNS